MLDKHAAALAPGHVAAPETLHTAYVLTQKPRSRTGLSNGATFTFQSAGSSLS
jgi:hypothetical protein